MKYFAVSLVLFSQMGSFAHANCTQAYADSIVKDKESIRNVGAGGGITSLVGLVGGGVLAESNVVAVAVGGTAAVISGGFITADAVQIHKSKKMLRLLAQSAKGIEIGIELNEMAQTLGTDLPTAAAVVRSLDEREILCMPMSPAPNAAKFLLSFELASDLGKQVLQKK